MIGKKVLVFQEVQTNFLRLVGKGFVKVIGMGILRIERENNKGTIQFDLQHVVIEQVMDDPDARPMFDL